ncbi:hypothetical protein B0H16DRAFT_1461380 [Mycena metata]|uniref:Uncharacterized protein n=1 Tax=Mycena metata TaxID=1033252 RepID=A0AAD7IR99_9AGAR|nr:hypothetical protein B0H16DRAFT_1461380 [Mycena metata]
MSTTPTPSLLHVLSLGLLALNNYSPRVQITPTSRDGNMTAARFGEIRRSTAGKKYVAVQSIPQFNLSLHRGEEVALCRTDTASNEIGSIPTPKFYPQQPLFMPIRATRACSNFKYGIFGRCPILCMVAALQDHTIGFMPIRATRACSDFNHGIFDEERLIKASISLKLILQPRTNPRNDRDNSLDQKEPAQHTVGSRNYVPHKGANYTGTKKKKSGRSNLNPSWSNPASASPTDIDRHPIKRSPALTRKSGQPKIHPAALAFLKAERAGGKTESSTFASVHPQNETKRKKETPQERKEGRKANAKPASSGPRPSTKGEGESVNLRERMQDRRPRASRDEKLERRTRAPKRQSERRRKEGQKGRKEVQTKRYGKRLGTGTGTLLLPLGVVVAVCPIWRCYSTHESRPRRQPGLSRIHTGASGLGGERENEGTKAHARSSNTLRPPPLPHSHRLHATCGIPGKRPQQHLARALAHKRVLVDRIDVHPAREPRPRRGGQDDTPSPSPPGNLEPRGATLKRARPRSRSRRSSPRALEAEAVATDATNAASPKPQGKRGNEGSSALQKCAKRQNEEAASTSQERGGGRERTRGVPKETKKGRTRTQDKITSNAEEAERSPSENEKKGSEERGVFGPAFTFAWLALTVRLHGQPDTQFYGARVVSTSQKNNKWGKKRRKKGY